MHPVRVNLLQQKAEKLAFLPSGSRPPRKSLVEVTNRLSSCLTSHTSRLFAPGQLQLEP